MILELVNNENIHSFGQSAFIAKLVDILRPRVGQKTRYRSTVLQKTCSLLLSVAGIDVGTRRGGHGDFGSGQAREANPLHHVCVGSLGCLVIVLLLRLVVQLFPSLFLLFFASAVSSARYRRCCHCVCRICATRSWSTFCRSRRCTAASCSR